MFKEIAWPTTFDNFYRKFKAFLLTYFYLYPVMDRQTRQSDHAFVKKAFDFALKRAVNDQGTQLFVNLLKQGRPRWVVLESIFASEEYFWLKNHTAIEAKLHTLRCRLVQQLPPARVIVDLGGAAASAIEGALLWMGYPHVPDEITIIDLPPQSRMFVEKFPYIDQETTAWLTFGSTRVRYLHQSMTDLSGVADESVDLVWSGESIEHITLAEADQMYREVKRVLKPGGYFCLDTPNRAITRLQCPDALIHPEHKLEYTVPQLTENLSSAGFEVVQVLGLAPLPGAAQTGVFKGTELLKSSGFSENAEMCYLFYVKCLKPEAG